MTAIERRWRSGGEVCGRDPPVVAARASVAVVHSFRHCPEHPPPPPQVPTLFHSLMFKVFFAEIVCFWFIPSEIMIQ
ncbi:hypothetical protein L2E82_45918 [Cichorium intybus]|uniref:Uncharacterized protein n=1 Tax=Cichorium intybus TaxID=13427 RepID=A0ACB8ZTW4_CICIN|nr:hypothetical protein L2E82_45918 [Cichorium intybus]